MSISIGWIFILRNQVFTYPSAEEINERLNYLNRVISEPIEKGTEIRQIKYRSSEFLLFTYAFSSYAATNIAIHDTAYKHIAVRIIKECITKAMDYDVFSTYGIQKVDLSMDTLPDFSVLYFGHLNLMIGCYRLLTSDTLFNNINEKISNSLIERYNKSQFLNLESYKSCIWIPDNTVAIASLKLFSVNAHNSCDTICDKWTKYTKLHYIDKNTGVLFSTISNETGAPSEEPRGSMLGWSIMFIYQFDSEFAIEQFENYKEHFSKDFLIFRLFKERYKNNESSDGDIDSGPIYFGYSIPANEFALGNAILAGDNKTARRIERLINFGAKKVKGHNEIKYKLRFIKMNISPMAEALVLNSLTITKWIDIK